MTKKLYVILNWETAVLAILGFNSDGRGSASIDFDPGEVSSALPLQPLGSASVQRGPVRVYRQGTEEGRRWKIPQRHNHKLRKYTNQAHWLAVNWKIIDKDAQLSIDFYPCNKPGNCNVVLGFLPKKTLFT